MVTTKRLPFWSDYLKTSKSLDFELIWIFMVRYSNPHIMFWTSYWKQFSFTKKYDYFRVNKKFLIKFVFLFISLSAIILFFLLYCCCWFIRIIFVQYFLLSFIPDQTSVPWFLQFSLQVPIGKEWMHRGLYGRANIIRVWLDFWWCFSQFSLHQIETRQIQYYNSLSWFRLNFSVKMKNLKKKFISHLII